MSTEIFPIPVIDMRVVLTFRVLNAPGPILLGEDAHEALKLVIDHETKEVWSKTLNRGFKAEKLGSGHLAIDVCNEDTLRVLTAPDFKSDLVNALQNDQQEFGVGCVQYKESAPTNAQEQDEHPNVQAQVQDEHHDQFGFHRITRNPISKEVQEKTEAPDRRARDRIRFR